MLICCAPFTLATVVVSGLTFVMVRDFELCLIDMYAFALPNLNSNESEQLVLEARLWRRA